MRSQKHEIHEPPCTTAYSNNSGNFTAGTTVPANPERHKILIQNLGTNPLSLTLTKRDASSFIIWLAAGTANNDGTGGAYEDNNYQGSIVVGGTSPRFAVAESDLYVG